MTAKTKNIITWVLAGLLAFAFIAAGGSKLAGVEMQMQNLESWGYPAWFRFPIGLSEIALAIALLWPKMRSLATFGIFPWALVAVITHVRVGQYEQVGAPIVFAVLALAIVMVNRSK